MEKRLVSYYGVAGGFPARVLIQEPGQDPRDLDPRNDLRNHSPDGFAWGYGGSGPAQLALAILAEYTGDDSLALALYQDFKREFVATQPQGESFLVDRNDIEGFLDYARENLGDRIAAQRAWDGDPDYDEDDLEDEDPRAFA